MKGPLPSLQKPGAVVRCRKIQRKPAFAGPGAGRTPAGVRGVTMKKYELELKPAARAGAVVQGDKWRVTVLTDRLLRMEYDPAGRFTDSAT